MLYHYRLVPRRRSIKRVFSDTTLEAGDTNSNQTLRNDATYSSILSGNTRPFFAADTANETFGMTALERQSCRVVSLKRVVNFDQRKNRRAVVDVQSLRAKADLVRRDADDCQQILAGKLLAGLNCLGIVALFSFLINRKRESCEEHQGFIHLLLLPVGDPVQCIVFD